MLGRLSAGSGIEVALPGAEGSHPWEAGMRWLVHRAQVPSSLRAGDKWGHAWQLAGAMFNQPTDVQKLCRAADPTELMGETSAFAEIYRLAGC